MLTPLFFAMMSIAHAEILTQRVHTLEQAYENEKEAHIIILRKYTLLQRRYRNLHREYTILSRKRATVGIHTKITLVARSYHSAEERQ